MKLAHKLPWGTEKTQNYNVFRLEDNPAFCASRRQGMHTWRLKKYNENRINFKGISPKCTVCLISVLLVRNKAGNNPFSNLN